MMPNVAVLDTPLTRGATAAARNPRNADTCGVFDIAGRLGQANRRPAYLCRTIDALIADRGFPPPFPLLKGGQLSTAAHTDSRWSRIAVDAWFDNSLPPEARALANTVERIAVSNRLSANLHNLFGEEAVA